MLQSNGGISGRWSDAITPRANQASLCGQYYDLELLQLVRSMPSNIMYPKTDVSWQPAKKREKKERTEHHFHLRTGSSFHVASESYVCKIYEFNYWRRWVLEMNTENQKWDITHKMTLLYPHATVTDAQLYSIWCCS